MIAYTLNKDNSINIIGGSDSVKTLEILFKGQDFLITDKAPVIAGGKYYLDESSAEYQEVKAAEDKDKSLAQLDAQYDADKKDLQKYFITFLMNGDTESANSVKEEMDALNEQYDIDRAEMESE